MTAAMAIPGNGVSTFLVYEFGAGLEGDDRFVVDRFRACVAQPIMLWRRRIPFSGSDTTMIAAT
ncbi:MAG: hypothetical protein OXU81_17435 [Gammaproteobacteria bacterium]|nr:hypothetical protein [Gammaproteobacteria bacterium]